MAERSFEIRTEPHVAVIGGNRLLFQPEVIGARFASAYADLKTAQQRITAAGDDIGAEELQGVNDGMRGFLRKLMMPESAELFDGLELPDRVLVQMLEWSAELYGGGSGNQGGPGGPSSAS